MGQYQDFGVGIRLHNNDLRDVCLYGVASEALAITELDAGKGVSPHKGKVVYHDADGGRIMYQGTSLKHTLATMSDVGSATLAGLTDTTIASAATGDLLRYNTDTWENHSIGADKQYLRSNGSLPAWATIPATETQMANNRILGRITAEAEYTEELTAAQVITLLGIDNVVYDDDTITLSGDVTGTGDVAGGIVTAYNATVPVNKGGTNLTSYAQGDLMYASAATTIAKLAKSTTANHYLSNAGTNNNPSWQQIDYAHLSGVPDEFPVEAHALTGDKHTISATAGQFLKATGATTFDFVEHGLGTNDIPEPEEYVIGTDNVYFTRGRVRETPLTGYIEPTAPGAWAQLSTANNVLTAFEDVQKSLLWLDNKITLGTAPLEPADAIFNIEGSYPGTGNIDDVAVTQGMRVLVLDASSNKNNVLVRGASSWTVADVPEGNETIWIRSGTLYGGTTWQYNGTTEEWVQIGGATGLVAGHLISIAGTQISIANTAVTYSILANVGNTTAAPQFVGPAGNNEVFRKAGTGNLSWGFITGDNFATQGSKKVFAGPVSGSNAKPTFRDLASTDLPTDIPWTSLANGTANHVVVTHQDTGVVTSMANLNVARGGTGRGTLTSNALLVGAAAGQVNFINPTAAGYWLRSAGTTNTPAWSSWMLPSAAEEADTGKYLKVTGADTTAWGGIAAGDLPATTTKTYVHTLPSQGNTMNIMKSSHKFDTANDYIVDVDLWNKEGTEFRKYNVDYVVDQPIDGQAHTNWNRVTVKTAGSDWQWTANSYIVVTAVTKPS